MVDVSAQISSQSEHSFESWNFLDFEGLIAGILAYNPSEFPVFSVEGRSTVLEKNSLSENPTDFPDPFDTVSEFAEDEGGIPDFIWDLSPSQVGTECDDARVQGPDGPKDPGDQIIPLDRQTIFSFENSGGEAEKKGTGGVGK